ncbi:low affinity potassium transporter [Ceratobasidium sp. 395]|nr:low affinity potassium transporter [Ceratobasidium sp. 395]
MRYGRFLARLSLWAEKHLNFYRVHLLAFTLIPVISAAVFYASNGRTKISYLDSLFMCASAMTTSGLNTVNLSTVTVWQQVILAILMFIGNSTSISLVVLFVRKSYFKSKCEDAVRQARQQRHERELIRPKQPPPPSRLQRMRTRAATILGFEQPAAPPITNEAREDVLGMNEKEKVEQEKEKRARTKGRVRGETIAISSVHEVGSDEDGENGEKHVNGYGNGRTDASSGANGRGDEKSNGFVNGHHHANGNDHTSFSNPLPPTFTETAPTPSPPVRALPELTQQTESPSPAEDLRGDYVSPSCRAHPVPRPAHSAPGASARPRPRSLALGHESDRNVRGRPWRERAGTIRAGDVDLVESDQPEGGDQSEDRDKKKYGDVEVRDNESIRYDIPGSDLLSSTDHTTPVETTSSPTELSQHATSPNGPTQFATSTLSPNRTTFADSPNETSEFDTSAASAPKRDSLSAQSPFATPASKNGTLPSPSIRSAPLSPAQRRGTISTPGSRKATLSPLVRPAFLHPPQTVSDVPRNRRTTFAEQVHPLHPHGSASNGHGENHGLGIHSRRAMIRARNGTITSPMTPYSHLPTHAEGDSEAISLSSNGTELRSPPPAHHKYPYPHMPHAAHSPLAHSPHLHSSGHSGSGHSEYRRPRAHTGQGGLPSPFALAAQWGVDHVPAMRRFVGEHEREVVKEETRARRMSVYQRVDSDPMREQGPVGNGDASPRDIDEVSLEEEDLEKMGGDEYNALVVLSWIVAGHYFLHHAIAFVVLAPYSAKVSLVKDVIDEQNANSGRTLNTTWFALFTVISAYANAGLTVVDTSLIEMSNAYPMIFVIIWLILAGASAFPLSLRFFVWIGTKIVPKGNTYKGLKFLLKHPRRCFMYLFPSHQSWYLLFTLVAIFLIDWVAYLTFNIGMPGIEAIPTGPRVVGGFLQAAGQRAGGFTTINLQAIAPALQVVYIATMFVQVYPIAMAVRTSNVYEESGVVIYEPERNEDEPTNLPAGRGAGFTAYVSWHLKHQLAQDLFWLLAALTTLCAFERARILEESTAYFNIFSLFFEIVSAFANVGFSLGVSSQPFSLSGEFRTIPKLVIIGLMIRGRHRGLPMAIDRAVQLPTEYKTTSNVISPSVVSSRRSTGVTMSRRPTVGTYSRTSIRQRQRAQDPTLSSDEDD